MSKTSTKALYLFLCSILGMVLFAMLHRAIFVLYDLLILVDNTFAFGMSASAIQVIDFFALILALFLGGWYGIVLGLEWYSMVYGPNAEVKAGMFHGFIPHQWRGQKEKKFANTSNAANKFVAAVSSVAKTPVTTPTIVKVPVATAKQAVQAVREWSFDDLIPPTPAAKPAAKKRTAAKKTVAKKITRKTKSE